ncbi:hypothetical protein [Mesorhizobium sp. CAU 1732]|uniref:hypothetical protein n=1 Tax=Mesorhizobium sp. CAU 1732 TaxID=3140358 RepID=UPI003261430B
MAVEEQLADAGHHLTVCIGANTAEDVTVEDRSVSMRRPYASSGESRPGAPPSGPQAPIARVFRSCSSLTHLPPGTVWEREAIDELIRLVAAVPADQTALAWDTLGGIAIDDDIKLGRVDSARLTANFQETVRRLAGAGFDRDRHLLTVEI